jgi:hypothetical protein
VSTWFADADFTILFEPPMGDLLNLSLNFTEVAPNVTDPARTNSSNPFHAAITGNFPATDNQMRAVFETDSSFRMVNDQVSIAFDCLITVYSMQYSVVSGQATSPILSDPGFDITSALLVQAQYSSLGGITDFGNLMSYAMSASSLATDTNAFTTSFSSQLGAALLAGMASVVDPQKNIKEEIQNEQVLLARIPLAPLWTLVGLCLLSAVMGIWFSIVAIAYSSVETKEVVSRLNVKGIVSRWCEVPRYDTPGISIDDTFFDADGESTPTEQRVAITNVPGSGWIYTIRKRPIREVSLLQGKSDSQQHDIELGDRGQDLEEQNQLS